MKKSWGDFMAVPCFLSHIMININLSVFPCAHIKFMLYIYFAHFLSQKTITKFFHLSKAITTASLDIALTQTISVHFGVFNFGYLTLEKNIENAEVPQI